MSWLDRIRARRDLTSSATTKRIVCLANSRKMGGRCVAGKELLADGRTGGWIRPVSDRDHEEVSAYEQQLEDGSEPQLLDVIDVPLLRERPRAYQQENWLLHPRHRWSKAGRITWSNLPQLVDQDETLWINGHSSAKGINDRVPDDRAASLDSSLLLVKVARMDVEISYDSANDSYQLRGVFRHNGFMYSLRITDPVSEGAAEELGAGVVGVDAERFLTVSLGEPFEGFAYKLIAAIIRP